MRCPHCDGTGELNAQTASLGSLIYAARRQAGMTQDALAEQVGISRAHIANIETNRSRFDLSDLRKFATALGLSIDELVP